MIGRRRPIVEKAPPVKRPFTRVEPWVIRLGVWARLRPVEAKVLLVLCYSAHNETAASRMTISDIARYSGVARSSVSAAAHDLETDGVLRSCRFGNRKQYQLCHEPPAWVKEAGWVGKRRSSRPTAFGRQQSEDSSFDPSRLEGPEITTLAS